MSAPWVTQLRARPGVVTIGTPSASTRLHLRVEMPEVWDVVRIDAAPTDSVRSLKLHALDALMPGALFADEYVTKLGGCEIIDESLSLADAGAVDGSIFLVTHRRRRPVR